MLNEMGITFFQTDGCRNYLQMKCLHEMALFDTSYTKKVQSSYNG